VPDVARYSYRYQPESYRYGRIIQVQLDEVRELAQTSVWPEPEPNERGDTAGVTGHGLSAYRWRRCRCGICSAAKARSNQAYQEKRRARRGE
jgi:hypothetical protein